MAIRILIIEDEPQIADFIIRGLREEGYTVEHAADGSTGWHAIQSRKWDLILLDWWLPGRDGLSIVKEMREARLMTPVLMLTARDALSDRVRGLDSGADDYLCKPFAFAELLARIRALARRGGAIVAPVLKYGDVTVDLASQRADRAGKRLELTAKEQSLLVLFLRHPEQLLTRTRIYEGVWDDHYDGLSNTLAARRSKPI